MMIVLNLKKNHTDVRYFNVSNVSNKVDDDWFTRKQCTSITFPYKDNIYTDMKNKIKFTAVDTDSNISELKIKPERSCKIDA